jgi:hypothetical protein
MLQVRVWVKKKMALRQLALFALRPMITLFAASMIGCGDYEPISDTAMNPYEHGGGEWMTDTGFSHIVYDGLSYDDSITDCQSIEYDFAFMIGNCYGEWSTPRTLGAVASGGTMEVKNQSTGSWTNMDASSFLDFNGWTPGVARFLCETDKPNEYIADCEVDNDYDSFAPDFTFEIDPYDYNRATVYRGSGTSLGEVFLGENGDYDCDGVDTPDATVYMVRTSLSYDNTLIELLGEGHHMSWEACMPEGWYDEPEDTGVDTGDTGMAGVSDSEEMERFAHPPFFHIKIIHELTETTPESQEAYQAAVDAFFENHHPELYGSSIHLFVSDRVDAYFTEMSTKVMYDSVLSMIGVAVERDLHMLANKIFGGYWINHYWHWMSTAPINP